MAIYQAGSTGKLYSCRYTEQSIWDGIAIRCSALYSAGRSECDSLSLQLLLCSFRANALGRENTRQMVIGTAVPHECG